ncbi:MAG: hypothetical protein AABM67_11955 [Acidobacteriota bacterium]
MCLQLSAARNQTQRRISVICGILYGLCVYLVMNFVVLPLSALPFKMPYPWPSVVGGLLIHMFGIGLPIALAVRWGSKA